MLSKILVAYFSATGTTARAARELADAIGAELYEITPAVPYTPADLDWNDKNSRSTKEMNDEGSRPAIAGAPAPVEDCDTVFVGFPIWWYIEPRIIDTFLEAYDFSGKAIVPFATSGSSGLGQSGSHMQSVCPDALVLSGRMLNGKLDPAALKTWAAGLGI